MNAMPRFPVNGEGGNVQDMAACLHVESLNSHMDVSKNRGGPPKWMIYNGKPY